jgi:hypothetical protein
MTSHSAAGIPTYGSIMIDMATHRPIDVLPDREGETLAGWLRDHPGIEVICRDRAGAYAEGARLGAPNAIQVADPFHLWQNLAAAVDKIVRAHHGCLRELVPDTTVQDSTTSPAAQYLHAYGHPSVLVARTRERYAQVQELKAKGRSQAQISRELRLDPRTVRRYLSAASAEDLLNRTVGRSDLLADFKSYLIGRMDEGCTHVGRLHEELQALGWRGSVQTVRRFTYPARAMAQIPATAPAPPKARHITRWILTDPKHLDEPDSVALKKARSRCDHLDTVAKRVGEFAVMMRDLTGEDSRLARQGARRRPASPALPDHRPAPRPRRRHQRSNHAPQLRSRRRRRQPRHYVESDLSIRSVIAGRPQGGCRSRGRDGSGAVASFTACVDP